MSFKAETSSCFDGLHYFTIGCNGESRSSLLFVEGNVVPLSASGATQEWKYIGEGQSLSEVKGVPWAKPKALLRLCIVNRVTYHFQQGGMLFIGIYNCLYVHALSMAMTAIGCYCITWAHGHYSIEVLVIYSDMPSCPCLNPKE